MARRRCEQWARGARCRSLTLGIFRSAMRGDEPRVVSAFRSHLERDGWSVTTEVAFCDLVAEREGERLYVEAKGRSSDAGTDADILYGQLLRRMPVDEDRSARFIVVVPDGMAKAALRVSRRIRGALRIEVFTVDEAGLVNGPHD